jgi:hypothetical protein
VTSLNEQSQNFKRFRSAMAVGALLIFASFVAFQGGRDNDTVVTANGWVGTVGFVAFF